MNKGTETGHCIESGVTISYLHDTNVGYVEMVGASTTGSVWDQIVAGLSSQAKETEGSGEVGKHFRSLILLIVTETLEEIEGKEARRGLFQSFRQKDLR